MPLLDILTFVIVRETGRAEDRKIHTLLWGLVVKIMLFSVILITKFEKGNVIEVACEVLVDNKLADPYLSPVIGCITKFRTLINQPVWPPDIPPIMDSQYDREGAGRQQLLVILVILVLAIVVETVGCSKCKSAANLRPK